MREVMKPDFHNNLNTAKWDKDSWAVVSPGTHWLLMLWLGGHTYTNTHVHECTHIYIRTIHHTPTRYARTRTHYTPHTHMHARTHTHTWLVSHKLLCCQVEEEDHTSLWPHCLCPRLNYTCPNTIHCSTTFYKLTFGSVALTWSKSASNNRNKYMLY